MQNEPQSNPDPIEQSTTNNASQPAPANNKKLIMVIGLVLGLLLVVLIALVAMLLTKDSKEDTDSNGATEQSSQRNQQNDSDQAEADTGREVLKRVATTDPKLEYVIYKPQQNASNTTIYFAVENVCDGCESSVSAYQQIAGFDHRTGSYLVDDNNGKKYSTIKDEDGKVLATTMCNQMVKYGEKVECFVSFSKVPSGSTVSWVFGNNRIDNIKVD